MTVSNLINAARTIARRITGQAMHCTRCGGRLDYGLPVLAIASPSKLGAQHAATCPRLNAERARA